MIKDFEKTYEPDFPIQPSEYRILLDDPQWRKLQQYANEVHQAIYPTL